MLALDLLFSSSKDIRRRAKKLLLPPYCITNTCYYCNDFLSAYPLTEPSKIICHLMEMDSEMIKTIQREFGQRYLINNLMTRCTYCDLSLLVVYVLVLAYCMMYPIETIKYYAVNILGGDWWNANNGLFDKSTRLSF